MAAVRSTVSAAAVARVVAAAAASMELVADASLAAAGWWMGPAILMARSSFLHDAVVVWMVGPDEWILMD